MADAERYVNLGTLKKEVPFLSSDFRLSDEEDNNGETEWDEFLLDKLGDESDRVENWFSDHDFDEDDTDPSVKEGIIRLVRLRLDLINSDGLESENLADGSSYDYKNPKEIRNQIKEEIAESVSIETEDEKGAWVV